MNSITLFPSSTISTTLHLSFPSPKVNIVPIFALLPGLARHSHLSPSILFKRRNSIFPPVFSFSPIRLAGKTLVLFNTRVSPGFK